MAKGSASKEIIFAKMQEVFAGSFMADAKTLRIPMAEDGQIVEIKVTLTAAKDVLGSAPASVKLDVAQGGDTATAPSEEEKRRVESMIRALGGRIK